MLRNTLFFLFLLASAHSLLAQKPHEVLVSTQVKQVTVFLDRAELLHQEEATLKKGENLLILRGISPKYIKESVQIAGKGDFIIMSVKPQVNHLDEKHFSKQFQKLQDSLKHYQNKLRQNTDEQDVLNKEVEMLVKNQQITGTQQILTPTQLKDMADFMRKQLLQTKDRLRTLSHESEALKADINRVRTQQQSISHQVKTAIGEVHVEIDSKKEQKVAFLLKYLVTNAGWQPLYDLRAEDSNKPITLNYKAQVKQTTGVDWERVKLFISTINPTMGATKPQNPTRWLSIYSPQKVQKSGGELSYAATRADVSRKQKVATTEAASDDWGDSWGDESDAQTAADYVSSKETPFATTFEVKLPYTIPSDGRQKIVEVQNYELPAAFTYAAVPSAETAAFLVAYVTDWQQYNLVTGKANIYFDNGFVGETLINATQASDSLLLSMGRDTRLLIERKALKDYNKRRFVGTQVRESKGFEISLKNNRSESIEVEIEDYIPLSMDSRIVIEDNKIDNGGTYDPNTGKVVWKLKLAANESKKLLVAYTIRYPKGLTLQEQTR
jgi:uncharacterized protein (TIGR02231 family)